MPIQVEYAKGLQWADATKTALDMTAKLSTIDAEIPFTAKADDPEPHGRDAFARAMSGEFGAIADYVEPIAPAPTESSVRSKRDSLLQKSDWTQLPDAPTDKSAWATYRQALRDVPQQSGFPDNVIWPEKPK